jgi:Helix-turn-helix domain
MLREAAEMLGISTQTLRKTVHMKELKAPSFWVMFGQLKIYLYTREDVEEVRAWLKAREEIYETGSGPQPRVGRPRKYTDEERSAKQREYAKSYYWRKQLERGEQENNQELIIKAKAKLYELKEEQEAVVEKVDTVVEPESIEKSTIIDDENTVVTAFREPAEV